MVGTAPSTKPTATVMNKLRARRFRKAALKISAMMPAAVGDPTITMIQPKNPILPIKETGKDAIAERKPAAKKPIT